MQKLTIAMPIVSQCTVTQCAYNTEKKCHAKAITIGDVDNPGCDTYFKSSLHSERVEAAGVGACKIDNCQHNKDFECMADSIVVGKKNGQINCLTFEPNL